MKNYIKLIKANIFYLLSKRNIILLFILNISSILVFVYNTQIYKGFSYLDANRFDSLFYFEANVFQFIKFIYVIFVVFINMSYFTGEYSNYSAYFIKNRRTKIDFYITKYLSVILLDSLELIYLYFNQEFIKVLMPFYSFPFVNLNKYISLYVLGLFIFFLSSLILIISKSIFSSIFTIILFWFSDILSAQDDSFSKVLSFFFIHINDIGDIKYGILHGIYLTIILVLASIIIIKNKDTI